MQAVLDWEYRSAVDIFGCTDARKLRSCATLFAWVSPSEDSPEGSVFQQVLETFFSGKPDSRTLELAGITREGWSRLTGTWTTTRRASSSSTRRKKCHPPDPRDPWRGTRTPVFRYFNDWASAILECPCCGWRGTFWEGDVEPFEHVFDSCCPRCTCQRSNRMLAVVAHATLAECEIEANLQKLPPEEREEVEAWVDRQHRWEATRLKSPTQLPELVGEELTFTWDFEDSGPEPHTVIRWGEVELWRELAVYGGGERFKEIAEIVVARYGDRVVDLVPSPASEMYLYDDSWRAPDLVEEARRLLRRSGL